MRKRGALVVVFLLLLPVVFAQTTLTPVDDVYVYEAEPTLSKWGDPFLYVGKDANGKTQAVLFAALDLAWLNKFAEQAELPPGATLTVVDNKGIILVRHPGTELVGTSAPEQKLPITKVNLVERGLGIAEVVGDDGVPYLMAFAPLREEPQEGFLHLVLTVPKSTVTASVDKTFARNISGLTVASLLSLVLLRFTGL